MCGLKPLLGSKSEVGIGPGCLPNRELSLLCGRITLGHLLVGQEFELVQGTQHFTFLRSTVSVSSPALFVQVGALFLSALFPPGVDQLQIQV